MINYGTTQAIFTILKSKDIHVESGIMKVDRCMWERSSKSAKQTKKKEKEKTRHLTGRGRSINGQLTARVLLAKDEWYDLLPCEC